MAYVVHVQMYMYTGVIVLISLTRNACEKIWGEELKDLIEDRGKRGKYVHVACHMYMYMYMYT